ncbi:MAG TPA: peptidoglycan bridge formation glycyltransferase FemA/FemB family protein [Candidatus Sulfotelmatobacter sp.]|nr:peptidoglycan bridge formation glycyltransferase FemA/FemB family protein [Candidatus Sulfotelmatobacter sp.]
MKDNIHPLQSNQWGEFRKKTKIKVIKVKGIILTIHPIPHTNFNIGYAPKGPEINQKMLDELFEIGKKENCIFIQLEPNIKKTNKIYNFKNLVYSARPLFTKYTFILDLTKPDEEILKNMHPKTRYNIRLAEKKGVRIIEDNSDKSFEEYLRLTKETTKRQKFYAHNENYHKLMWQTLKQVGSIDKNKLSAHLLRAVYENETLAAWILFVYKDKLYYPYGTSSNKYREVMASNLIMWEAIRFGKKLGLKEFDMWGALGPNPDKNDSWYGFHKFKEGYGAKHVEFIGSYDLIINKKNYLAYKLLNQVRWFILKFK